MEIWLINPYGELPGEKWREHRFESIAATLVAAGHTTTWWMSNFAHRGKRHVSEGWSLLDIRTGFRIGLVPSPSYSSNIGIRRLLSEVVFSIRLYRRLKTMPAPGCIIATERPAISGYVAAKLAKKNGIPLVYDLMDLWPELFLLALPKMIRPAAPLIFSPFHAMRRINLAQADAVTSLCDTYLAVVKKQVPHLSMVPTSIIYNGIDIAAFRDIMSVARAKGGSQPLSRGQVELRAIFAGMLGDNYDIDCLVRAALLLKTRARKIIIQIAGEGPRRQQMLDFVRDHQIENVEYLGRLSHTELIEYYMQNDVGLCAYHEVSNVMRPDKAYDYMAAGLPIINSLKGEFEEYVLRNQIGLQYTAGNPESLAGALETLAADKNRCRILGENSYRLGSEFDRSVQYSKLLDILKLVTRQCPSGNPQSKD